MYLGSTEIGGLLFCMEEHIAATGLDVAVNAWSKVFDFTPMVGGAEQSNWILLEAKDQLENFMSQVELLHCTKLVYYLRFRLLNRIN